MWAVKLSRQIAEGGAVENVKTAKKFIAEEISQMGAAERAAFIESEIKVHFGLSDGVIAELVKTTTSRKPKKP